MTVARARTLVARPEGIWRILNDPDQLPRWWPGVQRVEDVSPGAWTKVLRSPKGKAVRADYSLEEAEPVSRMIWRHEVEESPFERLMSEALYQFDLEPRNGDTQVKITARLRLRGLSRLGSLQVRHATARRLEEALDGLEEVVR